ncbi:hypothetical protein ACI789_17365 [Geodermatophilus sp. SYSU D00965]
MTAWQFVEVVLLPTAGGPVAADLQHVHLGLREWDLTGAPPAVRTGYVTEAERLGLPPLDEALTAVAERGRDLQLLAVLPLDVELTGPLDGLTPLVEAWRAKPPLPERRPPRRRVRSRAAPAQRGTSDPLPVADPTEGSAAG